MILRVVGRRGVEPAPLDDPLSYPGRRATAAFRLRGSDLTALRGPVPFHRHAVLAVGSNACPAQLAAKFRGQPCSDEVVGFVVTVASLRIRPSAHLGRSGYWPFAPAASPGGTCEVVLGLFDDEQLAVLDATEPNYVRTRLDHGRHAVHGAPSHLTDQLGDGVEVYLSRHGIVDDPRLPAWGDPPPTQAALLSGLLPLLPVPDGVHDAASLSGALRSEPGLAARLTEALKQRLVVRDAGLGAPVGEARDVLEQ